MNESEMRRRELLRETRRMYRESESVPAVHPRYKAAYQDLYRKDTKEERDRSGFYFRLILAVIGFICYVYFDQNQVEIAEVSSAEIRCQIEKDTYPDDFIKFSGTE